jgi:Uma2 family endonuclease
VNRIGNVFRRQRIGAFIDGGGSFCIAFETHFGKFASSHHARLNVGDADRSSQQIGAQIIAELMDKCLHSAIHVTAGIGKFPGNGAEIDDIPAPALNHAGQQQARAVYEPFNVAVDHSVPIVQVGFLRRIEPEGAARIVDEHIYSCETGRQFCDSVFDLFAITYIKHERKEASAQFLGKCVQTICPAARTNYFRAILEESLCGGQTEPGRGAGDENSHTFRIELRGRITVSTVTLVPLSEYLETSYRPDCEYLEGELLERNVGEWDHSRLQGLLCRYLSNREKQWGILVVPEQRVQVKARCFRVADILVLTGPPSGPIIKEPSFLCIEILSPSDRMGEMQDRIDDYMDFGVRYVWLIHPRKRRAFIYTSEGVQEVKDGILHTANPDIRVSLTELD